MNDIFPLILTIITLITGIFWCLDRLKIMLVRFRFFLHFKKIQKFIVNSIFKCKSDTKKIGLYKKRWIEYCISIFPTLLIVFIIRSFIVEPFQIPSGSMMPTLLIGDFILVNKFSYGIKNPITNTTFIKINRPKRGDVVVFKYPLNPSINYIKRVIGIPGDRISYNFISKQIMIYPQCTYETNCYTSLQVKYSNAILSNFVQKISFTQQNKKYNDFLYISPNKYVSNGIRLLQRRENIDGVIHDILLVPNKQDITDIYYRQLDLFTSEWFVPQGQYFMMGDNRDNSSDSRYWGLVSEKNLIGKAIAIWMSFDKKEGQWPTGIRLKRIGNIY